MILKILDEERKPLSIRQVTIKLLELFEIAISPQVVKRHLLKLEKEGKIK